MYSSFNNDPLVNCKIIEEKWRVLISDSHILVLDIKLVLYIYYCLKDAIFDWLRSFMLQRLVKSENSKKEVRFDYEAEYLSSKQKSFENNSDLTSRIEIISGLSVCLVCD